MNNEAITSKGLHLDLSHSSLEKIPEDLPNFEDLSELRADSNRLTNIEDERFKSANNLQKIDLSHNLLIDVTIFETSLKNLRVINLSHNKLTSMPKFACLQNLRELYLSNNLIDYVPIWILKEHYCLNILDLSDNPLFRNKSYVNEYRLKGRIAYLNLSSTGLSFNNVSLLKQFWFAAKLNISNTKCRKKFNSIYTIQPGEIPDSVVWLKAKNVELTKSPDLIRLERLEHLDLSENPLITLNSKTLLPSLRVLILNNCKIFDFPHNLDDLINIMYLDLSSNQIMSLPRSFNQLTTLVHLDLYDNEFVSLPCLEGLKGLKRFDISYNYFKVDPEAQINNTLYESLRDALRNEIKTERSNDEKVYAEESTSYDDDSESSEFFEASSDENSEGNDDEVVEAEETEDWDQEPEFVTETIDDFDPTIATKEMEEKPFNMHSLNDIINYCPESVRRSEFFHLPFQGRDRESYKDVTILCSENEIVEGQFDDCSE